MLSLKPDQALNTGVINKENVAIARFQVFLIHSYEAVIIKEAAITVLFFIFTFMRTVLRGFFSLLPFPMRSAGTITAYLVSAMVYTDVINIVITKTQRLRSVGHRKPSLQKKKTKILIESPRGVGCLILKLFLTP